MPRKRISDSRIKHKNAVEIRYRRKVTWVDPEVVKILSNGGLSMDAVAKAVGVSVDTVRNVPILREAYGLDSDRKNGRPFKQVDLAMVEQLAKIQCTQEEISAVLGVSVDTLSRCPGFAEIHKRGGTEGKASVRRQQFKSSKDGSITMQIWLGKQYLGQSDKVEQTFVETPEEILDRWNEDDPVKAEQ